MRPSTPWWEEVLLFLISGSLSLALCLAARKLILWMRGEGFFIDPLIGAVIWGLIVNLTFRLVSKLWIKIANRRVSSN